MEIWKPINISEFEGKYLASNMGRIKAIFPIKNSIAPIRILEQNKNNIGYLRCNLINKRGIRKSQYVHVLIANAFLGPRNSKEVNHLDLDKTNNKLSNLEYTTHRKNIKHAISQKGYWGFIKKYPAETG